MLTRARSLLVTAAVLAFAVSCSDEPDTIAAQAAAQSVTGGLGLPAEVTPCLTDELEDSAAARRVLDPQSGASASDFEALDAVIAACVPAETFAATTSVKMANGYRAVATVTTEQERCLHDRMVELSDDERGLIATGQLSQLRDPTSDRSTAVTDLLHRLLDQCGIVVEPSGETPGTLP